MAAFQRDSDKLLNATLDMDGASVAMQIEKIHNEYASVIQYHNENSLSSVLSIAYLGAMQYYFKPIREFPTGRGFADFVFIPKPEYGLSYPAMVIELKWNKSAETALRQIKAKKYPESIRDYTGSILLVGINYDEKTKAHECSIERYDKEKRPCTPFTEGCVREGALYENLILCKRWSRCRIVLARIKSGIDAE